MNTKGLMAGMLLAILILTGTGAALDFNAAFFTVYGKVTDGGAGVNGADVSLTANGVTITTKTMTNNRGETGFYIFELANIPKVTDTTPLTLSVTVGTKTATTTITRGESGHQQVDLVPVSTTPVLTTITVTPATASVVVGSTQTFTASALDQSGNPIAASVTWSISDPGVGTIDAAGVFTASAAGTATVTATNGSVSGTATVTVVTPVLSTITVSPQTATVVVGNTRSFGAAALDQLGNPITAAVTWSSSNTTVGTIDNTGLFTAKAAGTARVNATSGIVTGSAVVTVNLALPVLNGAIAGKVTNASSGAAIAGAIVTAGSMAAATDAAGNYSISIAPGTYTVTASSAGFVTQNVPGIAVASGATTTQNFALSPVIQPINVTIEVRDNINPRAQGVIRVVILNNTPTGFDVATIDIPTVRFGNAQVIPGKNETVDKGLQLHFNVQDTGIECGDTQVILTGKTLSGQDIIGTAGIITVGCEDNRGRGGSSGSSGGGGVTTDEPFENIEKAERHEKALVANTPVTYNFATPEHGVEQIVVTGNENENDIAMRVEVLKGTAKAVTAAPSGIIYKNLNIIAGTKRIKKAVIKFKVDNAWMKNNNLAGSDMKMLRWNGKWVELETRETNKDSAYTHFEATTEGFSHFAIIGTKGETIPAALPEVTQPEITPSVTTTATTTGVSPEVSPPINLAVQAVAFVLIAIVVVLYIRRR